MTTPPSSSGVGRFTALVLGLVVFLCVLMIGGTGYLKYQIDRSMAVLSAPDIALGHSGGADQDVFTRLRRDLGYGGFLGHAQRYAAAHDTSGFGEMKVEIKSADDIASHMPDKTPAETRHEITAIIASFDTAMQKVTSASGDMGGELSAADMQNLYAALPVLDARITSTNAETRMAAQTQMQFWAMMLTLVSWCSLIIAAACAAGIYLTLRDKHSAPMRALAQSIQNMARGDMRTSIWGTERQDMIGELARAVDIARYHFSHLPDLSLLSDQGPVRMRFEGNTRSLFEAMMQAISRDSENIHAQSSALTTTVTHQQQTIDALSTQIQAVMQTILQRGQTGDQQIKQAISEMVGSAENLKNAHAHAADQLNRLIPNIQDRAQGLAEITHLTGKQISNTLQSLTLSEVGLKENADNVRETLVKISATADDLGERLFGAINLLQASGKILAETTEDIKGKLAEGLAAPQMGDIPLEPLAERLEQISAQLRDMPNNDVSEALAALDDKMSMLATSLPEQLQDRMQNGFHYLSEQIAAAPSPAASYAPAQTEMIIPAELQQQIAAITQHMGAFEQRIEQRLAATQQSIDEARIDMSKPAPEPVVTVPAELQQQIAAIAQQLSAFEQKLSATQQSVETTHAEVTKPAPQSAMAAELQKQLMDQWFQMSAQIEASRAVMLDSIAEQIERLENRLLNKSEPTLSRTAADYATQRQIEQQTQILSELVATLGILDTHMQQIKTEMHA